MKEKTKKQTKKTQAAQDKKPNEASGRKITQDALQSPHTTAKCHFTQSFTADTKPTRSTMVLQRKEGGLLLWKENDL